MKDIVLLLTALGELYRTLSKKAVESFKRFQASFKGYLKTARHIIEFIHRHRLEDNPDFQKLQRSLTKLLRKFFRKIEEFKPYLSQDRIKKSLVNVVPKVKWEKHKDLIRHLHDDLGQKIQHFDVLVKTAPELNPEPEPEPPRPEPKTKADQPRQNKYYAILVTTPPVHEYGPISDKLCATPDNPAQIPWSSVKVSSIPSLVNSLVFRRHFALCLVSKEIWKSKSKPLIHKFERQPFWSYSGDDRKSSIATPWTLKEIRKINAIKKLGIVVSDIDGAELCTARKFQLITPSLLRTYVSPDIERAVVYLEIQEKWEYLNIWWNDADFALILSSLLIHQRAIPKCRAIMNRLAVLRKTNITDPRKAMCRKSAVLGIGATIGAFGLTVVTSGAAAPLLIGSASWAVGSDVSASELSAAENERRRRRGSACEDLLNRFPQLLPLFHGGDNQV